MSEVRLIDANAVKYKNLAEVNGRLTYVLTAEEIDNAPTVDRWIPVKYRPLTEEERIAFADHYGIEYCDTINEVAFDCRMPEDGQSILVSTSWGVAEDVADNDIDGEAFICYGLEIRGDWDGVDAWMPKPEQYKKARKYDQSTEVQTGKSGY